MSKYLDAFKVAVADAGDSFQLIGDCLLVEILPEAEMKTTSGILISQGSDRQINGFSADRPCFVRVLAVGAGYYDDGKMDEGEPKSIPLDSAPGDILLVGKTSVKYLSTFGNILSYGKNQIGLCRDSDVQIRFKGQEGHDRFFGTLDKAAKGEVEPTS